MIGFFVKFIKGANPIKVNLCQGETSINKLLVTHGWYKWKRMRAY